MFDLKREVEAWSKKAYAGPCRDRAASVAELQDHLYCEVERLEKEGLSREAAFRDATTRLGATVAGGALYDRARALKRGRMANSAVWAALMIATSLVLTRITPHGSAARDSAAYMLLGILMPMWFASDLLLVRFQRRRSDG
jgi:hypothetical protein